MLGRLGIASEFRGGLRVTTPEAMDVVRMVLVGQVGRELVGLINEHGPFAVGMSGEDARLFTAVRRPAYVDGEPVDIGQVGDVDHGRRRRRSTDLIAAGRIPVISTRRARTPTACCTTSTPTPPPPRWPSRCGARKLVVLTDVAGPLRGLARHRQPRSRELTADELDDAAARRWRPAWCRRWRPACARSRGGVPAAHVVDGRVAALDPAGDLHLGGVRNDGDAVMSCSSTAGSSP